MSSARESLESISCLWWEPQTAVTEKFTVAGDSLVHSLLLNGKEDKVMQCGAANPVCLNIIKAIRVDDLVGCLPLYNGFQPRNA